MAKFLKEKINLNTQKDDGLKRVYKLVVLYLILGRGSSLASRIKLKSSSRT
jgi:hypothetical protein